MASSIDSVFDGLAFGVKYGSSNGHRLYCLRINLCSEALLCLRHVESLSLHQNCLSASLGGKKNMEYRDR